MTRAIPPFHLAFPVNDLDMARHFYGTVMGCPEGRSVIGLPGEQATMFFKDPSDNAIEIKAFASLNSLFAK